MRFYLTNLESTESPECYVELDLKTLIYYSSYRNSIPIGLGHVGEHKPVTVFIPVEEAADTITESTIAHITITIEALTIELIAAYCHYKLHLPHSEIINKYSVLIEGVPKIPEETPDAIKGLYRQLFVHAPKAMTFKAMEAELQIKDSYTFHNAIILLSKLPCIKFTRWGTNSYGLYFDMVEYNEETT